MATQVMALCEGSGMKFQEAREGEYRIFVGALEAPKGDGFIAALVVKRQPEGAIERTAQREAAREAYRDDALACGYRWPSADAAVRYAMQRAREMVRSRSPMLAC
jgi:hypothetical protein